MLTSLRHDAIVCRNNQQRNVKPRGSGDHVANKAFVSRDVHNTEAKSASFKVRESEIDRDTARLFLRQTVRVNSRQSSDESSLAVINMTGSSQQDRLQRSVGRHVYVLIFQTLTHVSAARMMG